MGFCLKNFWIAISALLLLSFAHSGSIEISNFPGHITFNKAPELLEFTIINNSDYRVPVEISFFMPVTYETIKSAEWIEAGKSGAYSFRLAPESPLEGTSYETSVIVKAGNDEITRKL